MIDPKEAPEGYLAVEPTMWAGKCGLCDGCAFYTCGEDCGVQDRPLIHCVDFTRSDKQDVIFKLIEENTND